PRSVRYIEETVSRLERALYSEEKDRFLRYRDQIDMTSFADYFIINELFGNYDAQWNSFFMHKDLLQPLRLGPVWDFDQAIGNNAPFVFNTQATAMQNAVWIDKMFQDSYFAGRLSRRYHELRGGALSERNLERFIDDAVRYLGDARVRDWSRWRYDNPRSLPLAPGDVIHANLLIERTYEEEIAAMKQTLREYGRYLDENIDKLFWDLIKY
ncbi:MAG: CotH kinase family protein, partial [Planctomycetes bacterium]|nr:CotH kinase family protein [Planctomycetota bacterium]